MVDPSAENFKKFCAKTSVASSSIQYENDDLMRVYHGDDYGIACCVSSMRIGKEMQFFGARANLAKCLLYALNGGVDEVSKKQVGPKYRAVEGDTLDYDDVVAKYNDMMKWLAGVYVNSLNIIHYMHDKYCYERIQMALHDKHVHRWFATGIAGLSVVADSCPPSNTPRSTLSVTRTASSSTSRPRASSPSTVTTTTASTRSLTTLCTSSWSTSA